MRRNSEATHLSTLTFLPAIHPGNLLAEELETRALGVPQSQISNILRGRTGITADTALRLGRWPGTGPELWLNMQKDYELRLADATTGNDITRTVQPLHTHAA